MTRFGVIFVKGTMNLPTMKSIKYPPIFLVTVLVLG